MGVDTAPPTFIEKGNSGSRIIDERIVARVLHILRTIMDECYYKINIKEGFDHGLVRHLNFIFPLPRSLHDALLEATYRFVCHLYGRQMTDS